MAQIELDKISKRFPDGTQVLHETSLTIHDGELFILIGPSGCGKSTLLNMIVGLEELSSGEIRLDGQPISQLDPKDRNMAMVFQSYAIYPHMTVRENIDFPLKMAGLCKADIQQKVESAAEMLELTDLLARKPAQLSGGQRQRVAMGRALVRNPAAFLLDEPLSNLDARLRVQMRSEIGRLQKKLGTTMIYVTHDQTEAMTLGDRIAILNQGVVQQIGTPQQLFQTPANLFVAGFIGSPCMNFVPGSIQDNYLRLPFAEMAMPYSCRLSGDTSVIVGFRPEACHIATTKTSRNDVLIFNMPIDRVEWLGSELFAYSDIDITEPPAKIDDLFNGDRVTLTFRFAPSSSVNTGDAISLILNLTDLHLFDTKTGQRLNP